VERAEVGRSILDGDTTSFVKALVLGGERHGNSREWYAGTPPSSLLPQTAKSTTTRRAGGLRMPP
jgi:hypothetical protein